MALLEGEIGVTTGVPFMGASQLAPASLVTVWTVCPTCGPAVCTVVDSVVALWKVGKVCLLLERVDETFLSGVAAFGGLLCVVAEEGSVGSVLIRVFVFRQTTAHDVLLPFSNIAWFLCCFECLRLWKLRWECLTPSFTWLNSFQWSVGSLLNVSVSTQTRAHGVLFP